MSVNHWKLTSQNGNSARTFDSHENQTRRKPLICDALSNFRFNEVSNADLFVAKFGALIRWDMDKSKWLIWDDTRWKYDEKREIFEIAKMFSKNLYDDLLDVFPAEDRRNLQAHAKRSSSLLGIKAFLELAKSTICVSGDDLDRDPYLFNTLSGTIDLRTGEIHKHTSSDLITKLSPFPFDSRAKCPRWLKFIRYVLPETEVVDFVQRAIGYSMTGVTNERSFFICVGPGRNGKSVFLDILERLLGDYSRHGTSDSILKRPVGSMTNDIARYRGARFINISETDT